ncbi:MAG: chemotaxis protein CheD [Planctomycetes bacterium]|nr:chemotaxis protein CheD [Planctomycetota bacterium]
MKIIVGVADMKIASEPDDVLVTHGLGSCLGISAWDRQSRVGGLLHVMLPSSSVNPEKAQDNPYMFVDTGVPQFFKQLYQAGAIKSRLIVKVAGGASSREGEDRFAIGERNFTTLRKMFWKNSVLIDAHDVGGREARTMFVHTSDGRVLLSVNGQDREL